jgi:hypothetical protein
VTAPCGKRAHPDGATWPAVATQHRSRATFDQRNCDGDLGTDSAACLNDAFRGAQPGQETTRDPVQFVQIRYPSRFERRVRRVRAAGSNVAAEVLLVDVVAVRYRPILTVQTRSMMGKVGVKSACVHICSYPVGARRFYSCSVHTFLMARHCRSCPLISRGTALSGRVGRVAGRVHFRMLAHSATARPVQSSETERGRKSGKIRSFYVASAGMESALAPG